MRAIFFASLYKCTHRAATHLWSVLLAGKNFFVGGHSLPITLTDKWVVLCGSTLMRTFIERGKEKWNYKSVNTTWHRTNFGQIWLHATPKITNILYLIFLKHKDDVHFLGKICIAYGWFGDSERFSLWRYNRYILII